MSAIVTPEQRDALYDQILDQLSGIGDIEIAIQAEKFENAERLSLEFSDYLQLLLNIGFGESDGEPVELTLAPEVVRRAFVRLRDLAAGFAASQESELVEMRQIADRSRLLTEACTSVFDELGDSSESDPQPDPTTVE